MAWNDEFELPDGYYIRYSRLYQVYHKRNGILSTNPPIHIYINRINNRLVFTLKDGHKLKLQTPETMKLFGSTKKKLIDKIENGENVQSLEVVEVVLVQCNLVDNQYYQKSEVLYTYMLDESYGYLLNIEPSNSVFLKSYNTEFDMTITFTDQNDKPLEAEDNINLTLIINK